MEDVQVKEQVIEKVTVPTSNGQERTITMEQYYNEQISFLRKALLEISDSTIHRKVKRKCQIAIQRSVEYEAYVNEKRV